MLTLATGSARSVLSQLEAWSSGLVASATAGESVPFITADALVLQTYIESESWEVSLDSHDSAGL